MHNFNNLKIWQLAIELAKEIYRTTESYPKEEIYALISQMQRAAVSIPSNIAEGAGRETDKDFSHFLSIALGSSFELYTQIVLSKEIGYIDHTQTEKLQKMTIELQKMISAYKKKIDNNTQTTK